MNTYSAITEWTQLFDRDGTLLSSYKSSLTTLNESGQPVEELKFGPTGMVQTRKRFGLQGLLEEETVYDADGAVNYRELYSYDEQGREREVEMRLSDDSVHGRWSSVYEPSGRVIERVWTNRKGAKEVTEKFAYDEGGRLVRKTRGNVGEWKYSYDDQSRLNQIMGGQFSDDEPDNVGYEYDENGRVIRTTSFYASGEVKSITSYEYLTE